MALLEAATRQKEGEREPRSWLPHLHPTTRQPRDTQLSSDTTQSNTHRTFPSDLRSGAGRATNCPCLPFKFNREAHNTSVNQDKVQSRRPTSLELHREAHRAPHARNEVPGVRRASTLLIGFVSEEGSRQHTIQREGSLPFCLPTFGFSDAFLLARSP